MGSNGGVDHLSKEIVEEGLSSQEMDVGFQQIGGGGVDESVVEKETPDEQLNAGYLEEPKDQKNSTRQSVLEISQSKQIGGGGVDESVVEEETPDEQLNAGYLEEPNDQKNSMRQSVLEISQSKEMNVCSSPRRGLDHCITAPVGIHRNLLFDDHGISFTRSMTEKKEAPRHDFKLDRLSEREKKNLIVNLVKIQNDGTVEVDITKSTPVASEFLELHTAERTPINIDVITSDTNKSIPKLNIALLVVGTRGDVQPFLAIAKRLQEFGHRVRLATHANFSTFVKSSGVEFYPLGGDPRVLAGSVANRIEKLQRNFLWGGIGDEPKFHLLNGLLSAPPLFRFCRDKEVSVAELMKFDTGVLFWDTIYGASVKGFGDDKMCWKPDSEKGFMVKDYYSVLVGFNDYCFPWKSIWNQKILSQVAFFVWTAAVSGKCFTIDNLQKRKGWILDWCYMCKYNGELVDHLFLHCPIAMDLWAMVFGLFKILLVNQALCDSEIIDELLLARHAHVAEALGVPLHIFFTMPWTPTYEFPHPLARVPQSAGYWLSYIVVDLLIWWGMRGYINDFRKRKLKLAPIAYFSTYHGSISHLPTGYMWSPHLVPKPTDWGPLVDVVGFCFLNLGSKYQPQDKFVQWIQNGPEPIYIGFGSMPLEDPRKTTGILLEALKGTGQRGIIDRGWGGLGNFTEVPDNVFLLEECPHDWLFPQCSAVVHHGGAGTTATGLKAGCPTTIVPFFGDQFFWGDRVHQKGLGPAPIPIAQLSVESLSNAINFMLQPEVKSEAMELAKLIENEDGVAAAVDAFHRHLPAELPLPTAYLEEKEQLNPLQWFFIQIGKWCCLPCGL
nr:sterol 3-beta-glucosyltransferase UGT80B1-like [Quercus suber]